MTKKPTSLTVACEYGEVPIHQHNMFAVLEGMPLDTAISHANCIIDGLREIAEDGVQTDGINAAVSWLMGENLKTVAALLSSIQSALMRGGSIPAVDQV